MPGALRTCSATCAAALAFALGGCHKKSAPPPLAVDKVRVDPESLAAAPSLGLGIDSATHQVSAAISRQGVVILKEGQPAPAGVPMYRLRAEVESARLEDVPYEDGGVGQEARVDLVLEISRHTPDGTEKIAGEGLAHLFAPPAPDIEGQAAAFKRAFTAALDDAAARMVRATMASREGVPALRKDLGSPDAGVREAAADVLVDRKDAAAIPVLVAELDCPDENVKMKAIGELVELRAKQAVPKLIDLAQTRDPRLGTDPHFQMQIIYALGSIGGDEAEAYLYTIASGHPDEMVRHAAQEASAELRRDRDMKKGMGKTP